MDIINNYLETMFAQLPDTEEVKRAKEELSTMMEDKYREMLDMGKSENEAIGIVISEFGNIDELAGELDLDFELTSKPSRGDFERKVTRQQAEEYLDDMNVYGKKIGLSVGLCICSPIILITGTLMLQSKMAVIAGMVVLFAMVAVAVARFIIIGTEISKYEYLQKEPFELDPAAKIIFEQLQNQARPIFAKKIALGVTLCILGVVPLIVAALSAGEDARGEALIGLTVGLLLLMVAVGVYQFVRFGLPYGCFDILLQKGEYSIYRKENKLIDKIGAIYWPVIVAAYLGYSFITNDWGRSWIIWPVAGVLFGAVAGICAVFGKEKCK